jgi:peroxiredoxin
MKAMTDNLSTLPPGAAAPDFKLPLLAAPATAASAGAPAAGGGELWLKQALTKGPVVLAFFKVSCPVCQYSFPFYDRLARLLGPRGVPVFGISQDDEQNTTLFRRTLNLTLPLALDASGYAVSRAYRLTSVPTVFEISPESRIVVSVEGWSKAEIEAIHARHMKGEGKAKPLFRPNEQVAEFRPG